MSSGKRLTSDEFIRRAIEVHGKKYDYSKFEYVNYNTKGLIMCSIHGEFLQTPNNHLGGQNCGKCGKKESIKSRTLSKEEFVKRSSEIHNGEYDYSFIEYINMHSKVKILCRKHGVFLQEPRSHLIGSRCPRCVCDGKSKNADRWLEEFDITDREFPIVTISGHRYVVDGFNRGRNMVYEYLGNFWHGNPEFYKPEDINPISKITFGELYEQTIEKINQLQNDGYMVIYKWGR